MRLCPICETEYTGRTDKTTCGADRCRKAYYRLMQDVPLNGNGTSPKQLGINTFTRSPRLICGKAENMAAIQSESVDLIITSPPYNLEDWKNGKEKPTDGYKGKNWAVVSYTDTLPESRYQAVQLSALKEMYRVSKPGASLFYNHQDRTMKDGRFIMPTDWLSKADNPWHINQVIIWFYSWGVSNAPGRLMGRHQYVYWMTKGEPTLGEFSRLKDGNGDSAWRLSTVWEIDPVRVSGNKQKWHQVPFPYELPLRCLEAIGRKDISVLDPYAGTCTTLKAAIDYGCEAIGNELCKDFLDRAIKENGWSSVIEMA